MWTGQDFYNGLLSKALFLKINKIEDRRSEDRGLTDRPTEGPTYQVFSPKTKKVHHFFFRKSELMIIISNSSIRFYLHKILNRPCFWIIPISGNLNFRKNNAELLLMIFSFDSYLQKGNAK